MSASGAWHEFKANSAFFFFFLLQWILTCQVGAYQSVKKKIGIELSPPVTWLGRVSPMEGHHEPARDQPPRLIPGS
jgi:ABC-type antimicrobial peptide transport system permease subunit